MEQQNNFSSIELQVLEYVQPEPEAGKSPIAVESTSCLVLVPKASLPERAQQLQVGDTNVTPDEDHGEEPRPCLTSPAVKLVHFFLL